MLLPIEKIEQEINRMADAFEHIQEYSDIQFRVNWHQGSVASDGLIRVHKLLSNQPPKCQFEDMVDFNEYADLRTAESEIKSKGYDKYKQCAYCWDNQEISLS